MPIILRPLVQHLRRLTAPIAVAVESDAALLDRFVCQRDEDAFAALVGRHGGMVLRLCRRVLGNEHAAADAFQACFLVLARRAGSIRHKDTLAAWLHAVALRLALRVRATARRQPPGFSCEPIEPADTHGDALDMLSARDLLVALDEEIGRLPERYRLPVLLCSIEGRSQEEAARQLDWTPGSVKGRLERGRKRLHDRLVRRGLTLGVALGTAEIARGNAIGLPASLTATTVRTGLAFGSAHGVNGSVEAARLAGEILAGSGTAKAKVCLALLLVLGLIALGASALTQAPPGEQPRAQPKPAGEPMVPKAEEKGHVDHEGVPLPAEAIARIGSARFRSDAVLTALLYSPDGQTIVAANRNGKVQFWDAADGKLRQELQLKSRLPLAMAFRSDGKDIEFVSAGVYYSFDVASGKELRQRALPGKQPFARPQFSPNGSALALASSDGTVRVVEPATSKEKFRLGFDGTDVTGVAFTPDGTLLAVCPRTESVEFFDAATGVPRFQMKTPLMHVSVIAFSPDGKKALCAQGFVQPAFLMDLTARKEIGRLAVEEPGGGPACAAFSSDSQHVTVGGFFGANVYDAATGKEVSRIRPQFGCLNLACAGDGKTLVTGGGISGIISQWDLQTGKLLPASADPVGELEVVRFTDGGKHLLTYAAGYAVYDARTGRLVQRNPTGPAGQWVRFSPLSPDGTLLAAYAPPSKGIALFDAKTGKEIRRLGEALDAWWGLAFSANSKQVIYADKAAISIADVANGNVQRQLIDPKGQPRKLTLSPDGRWLASVCCDPVTRNETSLVLWEFATGREAHRIGLRRREVRALAFSSDSMELAIAEGDLPNVRQDGEVRQIDTQTGRVKRAFITEQRTAALAYSPDRRVLAISDIGSPLRLWETASGQPRHRFVGRAINARTLAFSPDGSLLAASSDDAPAFVWDVYGTQTSKLATGEKGFAADHDRIWEDLGSKDAALGFQMIRRLACNPGPAVALLRTKLHSAGVVDPKQIAQWLKDIASEDFNVREAASTELEKLGDRIESHLQKATGKGSLETQRRLDALLAKADKSTERLREIRALEAIEQITTPAAVSLLEALARGDPGARLTNEAAFALARLRQR